MWSFVVNAYGPHSVMSARLCSGNNTCAMGVLVPHLPPPAHPYTPKFCSGGSPNPPEQVWGKLEGLHGGEQK